jgi:hypothetical protein
VRCLVWLVVAAAGGGCALPAGARAEPATTISRENALGGTRDWLVRRPAQRTIAGYCGAPSYFPGQTVNLWVDAHGDRFAYRVYRLGWYGGLGGRLVLTRRAAPSRRQPAPRIVDDRPGGAKLLLTGWRADAGFVIPSGWTTGYYLVRLHDARTGAESYASFVLRALHPAPTVVVLGTSTWQAYNTWGGLSLYRDLRLPAPQDADQRLVAHVVTSRRPYVQGYGAGDVFRYDQPLIEWLERRGDDVSYATDRDALRGRVAGSATRLVILAGHSEYHDGGELGYYTALLRRHVSLALLGGNDFVWHARFSHHAQWESVWRLPELDPLRDRVAPTIRWSEIGDARARLAGVQPVLGKPAALHAAATSSWPWSGSGLRAGTPLGRPLGAEWDGLAGPPPPGVRVLAAAPLRGGHGARVAWTLRTLRGGSFVFSGSELGFDWQLADPLGVDAAWINASSPPGTRRDHPTTSRVSAPVQELVASLIGRATGG